VLTFLVIAASPIVALCVWSLSRSAETERAAYSKRLERQQRKQQDRKLYRADSPYWMIPGILFLAFFALWSLFR